MDSYQEMRDRLVTEMMRVNNEARQIVETAHGENRDFTGEEFQEFERRNEAITELEQRVAAIDKMNRSHETIDGYGHNAERFLRPAGDQPTGEKTLDQRAADFFSGKGDQASFDIPLKGLQVVRNDRGRNVVVESRTGLTTGTIGAGNANVPIGFRAVLYEHLILNSAIRQTRATQLVTSSGEQLLLPKTTAHPANGTIVAQNAAINENDPTFGQGTLNAYKYGNLIQISTELEQDTAVDLLGYVAMATGRALANGSGADFITGSGSSKPTGVLVGAGTAAQVVGGTGQSGIPTYKELESVFDVIIPAYQQNGEWLMNQTTASKLRQITDLYGRPLWVPSLTSDMPAQLFGKPFYIDPNMPSAGTAGTSLAFGDFAAYFIRDVDGIRFERSVDYAFNTDMVTYRALLRTDGQLLDLTGAIGTYKGGAS